MNGHQYHQQQQQIPQSSPILIAFSFGSPEWLHYDSNSNLGPSYSLVAAAAQLLQLVLLRVVGWLVLPAIPVLIILRMPLKRRIRRTKAFSEITATLDGAEWRWYYVGSPRIRYVNAFGSFMRNPLC